MTNSVSPTYPLITNHVSWEKTDYDLSVAKEIFVKLHTDPKNLDQGILTELRKHVLEIHNRRIQLNIERNTIIRKFNSCADDIGLSRYEFPNFYYSYK